MENRLLLKGLRLLSLVYPLVVLLFKHDQQLLLVLAGFLLLLMLHDLRQRLARRWFYAALAACGAGIVALALVNRENVLRLYPFLMSLSVLNLFASAKRPEDNPMIGPMRSYVAKDPELLLLLERAKGFWIWGLALNSAVLGLLLFACDLKTWALYANFYSYLFLLALFALTVIYVQWQRRRSR